MCSSAMQPEEKQARFQILSLDGGGIRGIFSAAVLAYIDEDLKADITDHFDLIAGTSTGGILALALGLGIRPRDILNLYIERGPDIFPTSWFKRWWRKRRHVLRHKHDIEPLEQALKERFENRLLGESKKRLVIPAFNLTINDVRLFKTAHHERLFRDHKIEAWKVAMATSAAPTYFPAFRGIDQQTLIDGGVWANNPILVGLTEANGILHIPLERIAILSIGTFEELPKRSPWLINGGGFQWMIPNNDVIDVFMIAQSKMAIHQARHFLGNDRVLRINPTVPAGLFALDHYSLQDYVSRAAYCSQHSMPEIRKMFLNHIAEPFTPEYQIDTHS